MRGHDVVGITARILGALLSAYWLTILIGGLVGDDPGATDDSAAEGIVLTVLVVVAITATALAFRFGAPAAWAVIGSGAAIGTFGAVTAGGLWLVPVLFGGFPWMIVGTLFLYAALRDRARDPY